MYKDYRIHQDRTAWPEQKEKQIIKTDSEIIYVIHIHLDDI